MPIRPGQLYPFSTRTEIDLRAELAGMFHGSGQEIPKSRKVVLRRMRRDANGNPILAPSVSELTQEPDLDTFDPFALGERYMWDEEFIDARRVVGKSTQAGLANKNKHLAGGMVNPWTIVFFFEHFVNPSWYDRVVELELDNEGDPVTPYRRGRIFKPESVVDYRSDNGRIEYWGVFCSEKDAVYFEDAFHKR